MVDWQSLNWDEFKPAHVDCYKFLFPLLLPSDSLDYLMGIVINLIIIGGFGRFILTLTTTDGQTNPSDSIFRADTLYF